MKVAPWLSVLAVGVGALILGLLVPITYDATIRFTQRTFNVTKRIPLLAILFALLFSFALASVGLVYLSTTRGGEPIVIVLSFTVGIGVARWLRGDYRRAR